jgi:hypothetical protein
MRRVTDLDGGTDVNVERDGDEAGEVRRDVWYS